MKRFLALLILSLSATAAHAKENYACSVFEYVATTSHVGCDQSCVEEAGPSRTLKGALRNDSRLVLAYADPAISYFFEIENGQMTLDFTYTSPTQRLTAKKTERLDAGMISADVTVNENFNSGDLVKALVICTKQ